MFYMTMRKKILLPAVLIGLAAVVLVAWWGANAPAQAQDQEIIDTGAGTVRIGPELWGMLYQYAKDGKSSNQTVSLWTDPTVKTSTTLADQIKKAGGRHVSSDESGEQKWEIPLEHMASVIQRADVASVSLTSEAPLPRATDADQDPFLNYVLVRVLNAYDEGVPASEAALQALFVNGDKIAVYIHAPRTGSEGAVRKELSRLGIATLPSTGDATIVVALMPVDKIKPFVEKFRDQKIHVSADTHDGEYLPLSRSRWTKDAITYERDAVNQFFGGVTSGQAAQPPETTVKVWEKDLKQRLESIGADNWHDARKMGRSVKVGVIDWGFRNLNNDPDLKALSIYDAKTNTEGNAYCQEVSESVYPHGWIGTRGSSDCEPLLGGKRPMNHGVNVAELVRDVAPNAEMFYAQANSPRQVYNAAHWLTYTKDVDVIVHAGGWAYDGPGDGTSPLTVLKHTNTVGSSGGDEHSAWRYYPSVLNTVEAFAGGKSGPIWINAAGNMERLTVRTNSVKLYGGDSKYQNFLVLDPDATGSDNLEKAQNRTCQPVPRVWQGVYIYSLRWGDDWGNPARDLEMYITPRHINPFAQGFDHYVDTVDGQKQMPEELPYRRVSKFTSITHNDMCLRILVNENDDGTPVLPPWVQFQILTDRHGDDVLATDPQIDGSGYSVVSPSDSDNDSLIAVGARNFRVSDVELMPYSSQGPVFAKNANVLTATPSEIKPDLTAPSGVRTHTRWREKCDTSQPTGCEGMYFGGTSAATAHVGGVAALVTQLFKAVGHSYQTKDIADYIKKATTPIEAVSDVLTTHPNNRWGEGHIDLPCRQKVVAFPYQGDSSDAWSDSDCISTRRANRYADYFTFRLDVKQEVIINLDSATDSYLYLVDGLFTGGTDKRALNNNIRGTKNAQISRTLDAGAYTVVATTNYAKRTGSYTLSIQPKPKWNATLSPRPSTRTVNDDGEWHRFTMKSGGPVKVVVNPAGTARLDVSTNGSGACRATASDSATVSNDERFYVAGCKTGNGSIELRRQLDDSLVRTYAVNVKEKPAAAWTASLAPNPANANIKDNGKWHRFTLTSGGDVKVVVNPTGTARLELASSNTSSNYCPPEARDGKTFGDGAYVYISGCKAGSQTIELRRAEDDSLIRTYSVSVSAVSSTKICEPVTNFSATRRSGTSVYASWDNPSGGLTATGRQVLVWKYVNSKWTYEREINQSASSTSAWHLGLEPSLSYAYRVRSECGSSTYSAWTSWKVQSPITRGSDGAQDQDAADPTPTPTVPTTPIPDSSEEDGEGPPNP